MKRLSEKLSICDKDILYINFTYLYDICTAKVRAELDKLVDIPENKNKMTKILLKQASGKDTDNNNFRYIENYYIRLMLGINKIDRKLYKIATVRMQDSKTLVFGKDIDKVVICYTTKEGNIKLKNKETEILVKEQINLDNPSVALNILGNWYIKHILNIKDISEEFKESIIKSLDIENMRTTLKVDNILEYIEHHPLENKELFNILSENISDTGYRIDDLNSEVAWSNKEDAREIKYKTLSFNYSKDELMSRAMYNITCKGDEDVNNVINIDNNGYITKKEIIRQDIEQYIPDNIRKGIIIEEDTYRYETCIRLINYINLYCMKSISIEVPENINYLYSIEELLFQMEAMKERNIRLKFNSNYIGSICARGKYECTRQFNVQVEANKMLALSFLQFKDLIANKSMHNINSVGFLYESSSITANNYFYDDFSEDSSKVSKDEYKEYLRITGVKK